MEKQFGMKMDEDIQDDGWGRHRADDEVMNLFLPKYCRFVYTVAETLRYFSDGTHRRTDGKSTRSHFRMSVEILHTRLHHGTGHFHSAQKV